MAPMVTGVSWAVGPLSTPSVPSESGSSGNGYSLVDTNSYGVMPPYFTFNSDGSTVYFSRSNFISYATLSTNYDLQTINSSYTDFSVGNTDSNYQGVSAVDIVQGILFATDSGSSNNGNRMHVLETYSDTGDATGFKVYALSSAYDPTSMASSPLGSYDLYTLFQNTFSTSVANTLNIASIHYNADGTKLIIFDRGNKALYEIGPIDAYDYHGSTTTKQESLSSTSYSLKMEDNGISINSSYSSPFYVNFNEDGTHLWVSDGRTQNPSKLYRFDLSTGFDLSTLSYSGTAIETQTNANLGGTYARGIYEWTAGQRLFYAGGSNSIYTLSTPSGGGGGAVWYGARGVVAGGYTQSPTTVQNVIQYFNIGSPGNAIDFGNLTQARVDADAVSNGTRAVFGGGYNGSTSYYDRIDYVATATTGDAQDFGNLFQARARHGSASDGTKGIFAGGQLQGTSFELDTIDSITIATTGDATDFGNLTVGRALTTGWNNATRGVFAGGDPAGSSFSNVIDYITIASASDATDFGNMTDTWNRAAGAGDSTYALFAGGRRSGSSNANGWTENIDYITVATTGDATDFGDLIRFKSNMSGCADGIKACFSGGDSNTGSNVRLAEIDTVIVTTPGNATDFGDLLEPYEATAATSGSAS